MMLLATDYIFKPSDNEYPELDNLCFLGKNLYNSTLYDVRQYFFKTNKYKSYEKVNKDFAKNNQVDYRILPAKVSQQIQRLVDRNFKSFFALLEKKREGKYNEPVHIPKYLDKVKGRQVVEYTKQALSFPKPGYVKLSGTNIELKIKFSDKKEIKKEDIQAVRIVPCYGMIKVEILHKVAEKEEKELKNKYAAIDLGLNNLMAVTFTDRKPFIINGRPLKYINQYYNKQKAKYTSLLKKYNDPDGNRYTSKRLKRLSIKRNNKIKDYFHKAVTYLMNQLVLADVDTLIVGYNKGMKQDINLGSVNNQNFVDVPFYKLKQMLEYKCKLYGIKIKFTEESYTSKSSFIDKDKLPKYKPNDNKKHKFSGRRIKRGLYKTKDGMLINADVNGSLNIMRKVVKNRIYKILDVIEVCSTPYKFTA